MGAPVWTLDKQLNFSTLPMLLSYANVAAEYLSCHCNLFRISLQKINVALIMRMSFEVECVTIFPSFVRIIDSFAYAKSNLRFVSRTLHFNSSFFKPAYISIAIQTGLFKQMQLQILDKTNIICINRFVRKLA